jgi:hypothetical protein
VLTSRFIAFNQFGRIIRGAAHPVGPKYPGGRKESVNTRAERAVTRRYGFDNLSENRCL